MPRQTRDWQTGRPPNEVLVEVEDGGKVVLALAFYGRDGYRPHWRSEDGNTHWSADYFTRWRPRKDDTMHQPEPPAKVGDLTVSGPIDDRFLLTGNGVVLFIARADVQALVMELQQRLLRTGSSQTPGRDGA